jgi:hypothetical protein
VAILARLPRTRDQWNYPFVDTALLDLAQDGYLDLQLVDPFRCEAHSAAHELSHLATLLEQHLQYALSTFVRLHPTESQRGDTISRHETLHSDFSFPAGKRLQDEKLARAAPRGEHGCRDGDHGVGLLPHEIVWRLAPLRWLLTS